jgi:hypothetical protein
LGLQVWVHARFVKEHDPNWDKVKAEAQILLTDAVETLAEHKSCYLQLFQNHVDSDDHERRMLQLHQQNWHLFCMVAEFVNWRGRAEDSCSRVQTLQKILPAIRDTCNSCSVIQQILIQLIHDFKHQDTFESFCFLNELKQQMELNFTEPQREELESMMKSKTPSCLHLLLWSQRQLRLVNKFCNLPLCIQGGQVVCCISHQQDDEQLFTATVDPGAAFTCFKLQSGESLDAAALGGTSLNASHWKLCTAADGHVKICTLDGEQRYFEAMIHFLLFFGER